MMEGQDERVADRGGGIELARGSVWTGRGGGSSAMVIPLWDIPGGYKVLRVETIDRID